MKLWVLIYWSLSGAEETERIVGVFDSLEKAQHAREKIITTYKKYHNWYPANQDFLVEETYSLNEWDYPHDINPDGN